MNLYIEINLIHTHNHEILNVNNNYELSCASVDKMNINNVAETFHPLFFIANA